LHMSGLGTRDFQEKQACRPLYIKSLAIYRDSDNI